METIFYKAIVNTFLEDIGKLMEIVENKDNEENCLFCYVIL